MIDCPHCHSHASVERPSPLWWVAHAAAWIYAFVSVFGGGLTGPAIVILLPPLFAGSLFLISVSYAQAVARPQCHACGKLVLHLPDTLRARRRGLVRQHA